MSGLPKGKFFCLAIIALIALSIAIIRKNSNNIEIDPGRSVKSDSGSFASDEILNSSVKRKEKAKKTGMDFPTLARISKGVVARRLYGVVSTGDESSIFKEFRKLVYDRSISRSDAITILQEYLDNPDYYVRYLAAYHLLIMGETSGASALIGIVQGKEISEGLIGDLRVESARLLGKYRVHVSGEAIASLFTETRNGEVADALAFLGKRVHEHEQYPFVPAKLAITNYSRTDATEFYPDIQRVFERTNDDSLKIAAAWALARSGKEEYLGFLVEMAKPTIDRVPVKSELTFNEHSDALRRLGSIQSPVVVTVLEDGLLSKNPVAVQYSTVNLLFNQKENSQKAIEVVRSQLLGNHFMLGSELTLDLAAKIDDSSLDQAIKTFAARQGDPSWMARFEERKKWSIYNWIDDYVTVLDSDFK